MQTTIAALCQDSEQLIAEVIEKFSTINDTTIFADAENYVKRSVQIVFSSDSIFSTISAAMLKTYLDKRMSDELREFYTVDFSEVSTFRVNDVPDAYIWLGVAPIEDAVPGNLLTKFQETQHVTIDDNEVIGNSVFDDVLLKLVNNDNRYLRHAINRTKPFTQSELAANQIVGFISTSLSRLSQCMPELEFNDLESEMVKINRIENSMISFYHPSASTDTVMAVWTYMNQSLRTLGQPYNNQAIDGTAEEKLIAYIDHYRAVRSELENQGEIFQSFMTDERRIERGIVTNIPRDFWLARRIISMGHRWYHNTRITSFGLHSETNMDKYAVAIVHDGRSVNNR